MVAGPGRNGGDGYVVARLLRQRGLAVSVVAPMGLPQQGDARRAYDDFCAAGGQICTNARLTFDASEVVVDALLGTGLSRDVVGVALAAIRAMNASGLPILAVDTPSGLDTDTGYPRPEAVLATQTLTFVADKVGFYLGLGPDYVGQTRVDGLGLPAALTRDQASVLAPIPDVLVARCLPRRRRSAHKGTHGRVVIVGGGPGMPGAVRLAGEAALRVGAGLVTVVTHPSHAAAIAMACPELICLGLDGSGSVRGLLESADVVAVGPGLGQTAWARDLYGEALACGRPLVVDADALNLLAADPVRRTDWILTPHPAEAGRLLGRSTADVQTDRLHALADLVNRYGATVVLKGARSLVGAPGLVTPWLCLAGNPGMATAGMGDVLTGVIAGIAAQQDHAHHARADTAAVGVQVHAKAGDFIAYAKAYAEERGFLASDLLGALRAQVNP